MFCLRRFSPVMTLAVTHLTVSSILLGPLFATANAAVSDQPAEVLDGRIIPTSKDSVNANDKPDIIFLSQPELKALVSIDKHMNPYSLESSSQLPLTLRKALQTAVDQNLDISISYTSERNQNWIYLNSLSKFLPDASLGYNLIGAHGNINLPFTRVTTLSGGSTISTNTQTPVVSPFNVALAGFSYPVFQGGKVVFTSLQNRNLLRASRAQKGATLSDTLLAVTRDFYTLILNESLLQIRIAAVDTSTEQLRINSELHQNGLATKLDVLQARTQLSHDRENLVDQQIARRSASIQIAQTLNADQGTDLIPEPRRIRKVRLFSQNMTIAQLLTLAIDNRSELKQYEQLRLAAKKAIIVAVAPLLPQAKLGGYIIGLGQHLGDLQPLYLLNFSVNWKFGGLGTSDFTNVQAARWTARQRLLEANKELNNVLSQVRNALLQSLQSERKISEAQDEEASADEELRLAKLRFANGLGNNIDIINAQRDLTTAKIDYVQAVINFNIAQAQLLHDIGLTSIDKLTSGKLIQG
jgi:outer membrane factor, OMF family